MLPSPTPSCDIAGRLEEIRDRVREATPGPWEGRRFRVEHHALVAYCGPSSVFGHPASEAITEDQAVRNARFVAHAREDVPWLLELVRRMAQKITRMEAGIE